jgi:uncharacterized membrane protein YhaH (DUF805 family)
LFLLASNLLIGWLDGVTRIGLLQGLFTLGTLSPTIAVTVRRLHDTDRTGWWVFLLLGPFVAALGTLVILMIGSILIDVIFALMLMTPTCVLLYFLIKPGTSDENRFGPELWNVKGHRPASS